MTTDWNSNEDKHKIKRQVDNLVFSLYGKTTKKLVLSMPSLTLGCIRQCTELGLFDENTKHIIIEKGGFKYKEVEHVGFKFFCDTLNELLNEIYSTNKTLREQCKIYWGELTDGRTNISFLEKKESIEWGNYDTCSFAYSIYKWLPSHLKAFKKDAPIILTFDADYTNREYSKNKNNEIFSNITKQRSVMTKWFDNYINKHCKRDDVLCDIENIRIPGIVNYLTSKGIEVDFAGCYKEESFASKLMMIFSGRKK